MKRLGKTGLVLFCVAALTAGTACISFHEKLADGYFPVDLRAEANMAYMDDVENDGKGGWLDDGVGDLRFFLVNHSAGEKMPASAVFKGTPFKLNDAIENGGKAIIVFGSDSKNFVRKRTAGPFAIGRKAAFLRILHATGWGGTGRTAAKYKIVYDDGTETSFTLTDGQNVGDWFRPRPVPGAVIAWKGCSLIATSCGLYMTEWKLPHPEKTIRTLSVQGTGKTMYALVALTFVEPDAKKIVPDSKNLSLKRASVRPEMPETREKVNPLNFPAYEQVLQAEFKNIFDAKDAEMSVEPLPGKKQFAFTTRWDDSSAKHRRQAELMKKYGFRGTFMLNAFRKSYVDSTAKYFKMNGHSAGNHSGRHQSYTGMAKNDIFENIVLQQALIESALDSISVSFVFPGGIGNPDREEILLTGRVLNNSGIYSCPFMNPGNGRRMGLSPRQMFMSRVYHANDSRPDRKLFEEGLRWAETLSMDDPHTPRVTYGIHTMMDEQGFRQLEKIYAEYANRKEYWYCNENEYAAYRYSFYHANPVKSLPGGASALFRLTRYAPAFLGEETPLEVSFSKKPVSVRLNGIKLNPSAAGTYILPHNPGKKLPAKIACLTSNAETAKIPGVYSDLKYLPQRGALLLTFRNNTGKPMTDVRLTVLVPPHWKTMIRTIDLSHLAAGGVLVKELPLGEKEPRPGYGAKKYSFVCRADFTSGGNTYRLYKILRTE